jgi:thiol-disulfide isomerase/thioredoxin
MPDLMLGAGDEPGALPDVATTAGEQLTRSALRGALVGFFSPTCVPCKEQAPRFAERAAALGRDRVLAVAVGTPDATRELVALLEPAARVVVEIDGGSLQQAFQVQGYPAMCLLDGDGRIAASSSTLDSLPELSTA